MGGNLPIGASAYVANIQKAQDGTVVDGSSDYLNTVFPPASTTEAAPAAPTNTAPKSDATEKAPFKSDIPAFSKLNVEDNATPQKEVNGVKIFANGSKEKITTATIDGKMIITLGEGKQRIALPAGQMQQKGASIVYDGKTLGVKGLQGATITGLRDAGSNDTKVNNQILAENCNGCTFDLNDKANGLGTARDALVMKNCKNATALSGQNNAIVGLDGTTANVKYNSSGGQKVNDDPAHDWINKYHTNIAGDETSKVASSQRGTVNRDSHNPMVYDAVKRNGATPEDNLYEQKDGTKLSAADVLLKVINEDAQSPDKGSQAMFNDELDGKAPQLPMAERVDQVKKLMQWD